MKGNRSETASGRRQRLAVQNIDAPAVCTTMPFSSQFLGEESIAGSSMHQLGVTRSALELDATDLTALVTPARGADNRKAKRFLELPASPSDIDTTIRTPSGALLVTRTHRPRPVKAPRLGPTPQSSEATIFSGQTYRRNRRYPVFSASSNNFKPCGTGEAPLIPNRGRQVSPDLCLCDEGEESSVANRRFVHLRMRRVRPGWNLFEGQAPSAPAFPLHMHPARNLFDVSESSGASPFHLQIRPVRRSRDLFDEHVPCKQEENDPFRSNEHLWFDPDARPPSAFCRHQDLETQRDVPRSSSPTEDFSGTPREHVLSSKACAYAGTPCSAVSHWRVQTLDSPCQSMRTNRSLKCSPI